MNKYRYKSFWIDFQGDGRFPKERIKGKDKKLLRKTTIKKLTEDSERDSLEEIFHNVSSINQVRNLLLDPNDVTNFHNCFKNCENIEPLPEEPNETKKSTKG